MAERLTAEMRKSALQGLPGWAETPGREAIGRTFTFKDFNEAFGFMSRAALERDRKTARRRLTPCGGEAESPALEVCAAAIRCVGFEGASSDGIRTYRRLRAG
ncbi:MAG: 4a-hydroxytetrahydrobiopterin dehydratase [Alphaproteobacteria bacterium]|nr:MAG: 4a-hydroxytetrahydrobiopterin dehydratase [Alphaproteobacteria bacterium]